MKLKKLRTTPCRHKHQDTSPFLTAFAWCKNPEQVGYCWDCGSLKRDRKTWQYTATEERIRKAYRTEIPRRRGRKK